ncbi:Rieske (2Fe-2S) protein [Methylicorpusculum sp.]|uniref:Rieske (2Fe-2S) protein n=1 Tax=Methylicorpusculum sp. TaxID=2713644 RepID=UPI002720612B|nr:Rieske 2Fe-2S domain-containing protein [Methylicorpusculum sp.]MDO8845777.1 Rieske 2Fe-2S domain-containing protein [Methylicorpusculum sp.]MDP3530620.1 Rieske 2Fe-2S domain-containing protein [Methylicorpusculum sp.]MDZ4153207.1 Rieske 2Fe-2S domain-containing protein [Methylicorpusculum sp.]
MKSKSDHPICELTELQGRPSLSFTLNVKDDVIAGFLVVTAQGFRAYKNSCPHWGVELNWKPDEFFNVDLTHLMCSVHGALFKPDDGECIVGPCVRQRLVPIPITVMDGIVYYSGK